MRPFIFHLSDGRAPVSNFHLETFETEEEALRHARMLLDTIPRYDSVAVVSGETQIAELARAMR